MHNLVLRSALHKDTKRPPLVRFWFPRMTQTGHENLSGCATIHWLNQATYLRVLVEIYRFVYLISITDFLFYAAYRRTTFFDLLIPLSIS